MNTANQTYTYGNFKSFISTRTFALGSTGISVPEGVELQFDGTTVILNGQEINLPTLRGAVRLGWLVPKENYETSAFQPPPRANMTLHPAVDDGQNKAQKVSVSVDSDERVVMSQSTRTAQVKQAAANRGGYTVEVEDQHAVPLSRTFSTKAVETTNMTNVSAAMQAASAVRVRPGQGVSEADYLSRLGPQQKAEYLAMKEMSRTSRGVEVPGEAKVVGHIKSSGLVTKEGVTSQVTTGGGIETYVSAPSTAPAVQTVTSSEGVKFTNTNGHQDSYPVVRAEDEDPVSTVGQVKRETVQDAKDPVPDLTEEVRRKIAKALCPTFPDGYAFGDHWKRRLARIQLDYAEDHSVIRAIFAAETDDFKKVLIQEFPAAFG